MERFALAMAGDEKQAVWGCNFLCTFQLRQQHTRHAGDLCGVAVGYVFILCKASRVNDTIFDDFLQLFCCYFFFVCLESKYRHLTTTPIKTYKNYIQSPSPSVSGASLLHAWPGHRRVWLRCVTSRRC